MGYPFATEFTGNNQVLDTTKLSPVFTNLGYHPHCDFELDIYVYDSEEYQAQTAAEQVHQIH